MGFLSKYSGDLMEPTTIPQSAQVNQLKDLFARRGEVTLQLAILQQELSKIDMSLQQLGVPFPKQ